MSVARDCPGEYCRTYAGSTLKEWTTFLVESAFLSERVSVVDLTEHGIHWVINVRTYTQTNTQMRKDPAHPAIPHQARAASDRIRPFRRVRFMIRP